MMKMFQCALVVGAMVSAFTAEARQMLYCYDFETVRDAGGEGIYTENSNKGTGTVALSRKNTYIDWIYGGANGSRYGLLSKVNTAGVWLGDGSASLGCSGLSGFTLSFWVNPPSSVTAWSDFFGFRFGGTDVRFEYVNANRDFTLYRDKGTCCCYMPGTNATGNVAGALPANTWTPVCLVWNFNTSAIDVYVNGVLRCWVQCGWNCGHTLQQLHISSWVRQAGADRKTVANTGIDDLALFDFSATPEQVKWLAHHSPALPPEGPGRDMPYRFSFDRVGDAAGGVYLESYGSAQTPVTENGSGYRNWTTDANGGAFGTAHAYNLKYVKNSCNSVGVVGSGARGLGASIGTGFTFSIWVKGLNPYQAWSDFFGFSVGNRHLRGEWTSNTSPSFTFYGNGTSQGVSHTLTPNVWNNICMVWNAVGNRFDVYVNGTLSPLTWGYSSTPLESEVFNRLEVGAVVMNENGAWRGNNTGNNLPVDEAAIFNYSFSPEEVAEMILAPPMLPSFSQTNLVRTVSADAAWQGFTAGWTIGDSSRRITWPAWEDLQVEAAVTVAGENLTLTNDSFVTCRTLSFANGLDGASVRLALPNVPGAIFEPQALTLGDGVELVLPFGDRCIGAVTLGVNAKLVIDAAAYAGVTTAFTAGSFVLPEGETDVLAHTALVNGEKLELVLSTDGKQILVQPVATEPATAEWTNTLEDRDLTKPANWICRNAAGTVLEGALPTARTVVQLSGSTSLSVPPSATLTCARVAFTGNVTLVEDCDWRGLGAIVIPYGVTLDVNGHTLTVASLAADQYGWTPGTVTTGAEGGVLAVAPEEAQTATLEIVRLTGGLKLVKRGAGTLVLAAKNQTYTGGTEVEEGTLVYGTNVFPAGPLNASVKVDAGATLDMNGLVSTTQCIYNYDLAGTVRQLVTTASGSGYNAAYKCFGDITLSGDATIRGGGYYFANPTKALGTIAFNNHTLTVLIEEVKYVGFGAWNDAGPGGTLVAGGGCLEGLAGNGCTHTRFVLRPTGSFKLNNGFATGALEWEHDAWDSNGGTPLMTVYGMYKAGAMRPPLRLQDGAGIDLSAVEGVWSVDGLAPTGLSGGSHSYTEAGLVSFADGATITIDLGERKSTGLVASWTTPPANLSTLKFVAAPGQRFSASATEKGIFIRCGFFVLVR